MDNMIYFIGAVVVAVLVALWRGVKSSEKQLNSDRVPVHVKQWEPEVSKYSKKYGVPFDVAMSVLWVESAGKPGAVGSSGEFGLMQLKEIAIRDLQQFGYGDFDGWDEFPDVNIAAGCAFLALQFKRTGNWNKTIKAYNQGFQGMSRFPARATEYLDKVNEKRKFF